MQRDESTIGNPNAAQPSFKRQCIGWGQELSAGSGYESVASDESRQERQRFDVDVALFSDHSTDSQPPLEELKYTAVQRQGIEHMHRDVE